MLAAKVKLSNEEWIIFLPPFTGGYPTFSAAFLCPECLKLWASIKVEDRRPFDIRSIPCEACSLARHEDIRPVPGSLLDVNHPPGYSREVLDALPPELVRREFDLHLVAYHQPQEPQPCLQSTYLNPNPLSSRESTY